MNKQQLASTIWQSANQMRSKIEANEYKDYILGFMFYKYLSESSICTCSRCGDIYRRIAWNNRGKKSAVWRCCTRVENGPKKCDAPTIQEIELQDATVKDINLLISCSAAMKEKLAENIAIAIADDNTGDLEEINTILTAKQRELVKLAHAKKDYNDLADEIDKIRKKK